MGHNVSQQTRRSNALNTVIGDLPGWCILATCPKCRKTSFVHLDDLMRRSGGGHSVGSVINRLRCGTAGCNRPPSFVRLQSWEGRRENEMYKEVILIGPGAY